jgi:hypothetical protein
MSKGNDLRSHRMTVALAAASALAVSALAQAEVVWKGEPVAGGCAGDDGFHLCVSTPGVSIDLPTGSNARYCQPELPEADWLDDTFDSWVTARVANTLGQGKDRSGVMGGPGWDTLFVDTRARMWDPNDGNLFNNGGDNDASGLGIADLWEHVMVFPDGPGTGREPIEANLSVDVYVAGYAEPDRNSPVAPVAYMLNHERILSLPIGVEGTLHISCDANVEGGFSPAGSQSAKGAFSVLWDDDGVSGWLKLDSALKLHGEVLDPNEAVAWEYLGSQGQWYQNEPGGFPTWYAGTFCTLSLPAGYHFVPEPCTLVLLGIGTALTLARRG